MAKATKDFEANQVATQLTNVTTEQFFDVTPSLNGWDGSQIQIKADFPVSPTDGLDVNIYLRQDGINWDDKPAFSLNISNSDDNKWISIFWDTGFEYRVGVQRDGTTDIITSVDCNFRRFRWDII